MNVFFMKVLTVMFFVCLVSNVETTQIHLRNHKPNVNQKENLCLTGTAQSPINFFTKQIRSYAPSKTLTVNYQDVKGVLAFDGHTWKITLSNQDSRRSSVIYKDPETGKTYTYNLIQAHFHVPAEHAIDSVKDDFEFHFVHQLAGNGNEEKMYKYQLLVIGILANVDKTPSRILKGVRLNKDSLVEGFGNYINSKTLFHYRGSLTTPPCHETVNWFVVDHSLRILESSVEAAHEAIYEHNKEKGNNRDLKELEGRRVWLVGKN